MASENGARPLLPQAAPPTYTFVPQPQRPAEPPQQKNYVFVDEHNRHKRLKVMRACDGCRRRKIKCDAATTNTWPCGACTRLKLTCVPPTVSYEKDIDGSQGFELDPPQQYRTVDHVQLYPPTIAPGPVAAAVQPSDPLESTYSQSFASYQQPSYLDLTPPQAQLSHYTAIPSSSVTSNDYNYAQINAYDEPYHHPAGDLAWEGSETNTEALTDAMGDLGIDHTGVATYITSQKKSLASLQAVEDYEADLPLPQHTSSDYTVRIPPEMFPSDQKALRYFDYYFDNIHPYCPAINQAYFMSQWHNDRESISTLLLEAIFACSAMALEGHQAGIKWLALASKHEDSFKDVPRLNTVQAMIILLKAREAVPKRGYYYRSWMTVVNSVLMCQELEIDEHLDRHQNGLSCDSPPHECATKQRVWHILYTLEVMIGGPQGRHNFRVPVESCDLSVPTAIPGFDEKEVQVSRQFVYLMRTARNIRDTVVLFRKLQKRKKDWGADPSFIARNQDYEKWLRDLSPDLQITLPSDGSEPWLASHVIGQIHCYHLLSVVMHHRPQIHFLSDAGDPGWKEHMLLCYTSAKTICRIQEAIVKKFGLESLSCMLRGISFTIYNILTCSMVHLAAITAPDPELNSDAPDFFTRQMRLLERCVPHWDMPEMQLQINALREAFSADTSKPFELRHNFPQGSPPAHRPSQSPPFRSESSFGHISETSNSAPVQTSPPPPGQIPPNSFLHPMTHPLTPPISTTDTASETDSPIGQSLVNMPTGTIIHGQHRPPTTSAGIAAEQQAWNPTRIFDQWTAAFTPVPPPQSQQSPPLPNISNSSAPFNPHRSPPESISSYPVQQTVQPTGYPAPTGQISAAMPQATYQQPLQQQPLPVQQQTPQMAGYVSPGQWQDLIASSFGEGGLKRRWDHAYGGIDMSGMHKRSR